MPAINSRSEWGARPAKSIHRIPTPTPRLWVHHAADDRQGAAAVRAHQAFHMDTRGWTDIAYSFLIGNDGTIYEGRGAGIAGGHTAGDNTRSHAICLLGNFDNRAPTKQALDSLVWLARHGTDRRWWIPTLGGHRDAPGASTACPGRHLYAALPGIRARLAAPAPAPPPAALPVHQEDDDTMLHIIRGDKRPEWWATDFITKRHVRSEKEAASAVWLTTAAGGKVSIGPGNQAHVLPQSEVDSIPTVT